MRNHLLSLLLIMILCAAQAQSSSPRYNLKQPAYLNNSLPEKADPAPHSPIAAAGTGSAGSPNAFAGAPLTAAQQDSARRAAANPLYRAGDSVIRLGLILPFDAQNSLDRLYSYMGDREGAATEASVVRESVQDALDFYEGLRYALSTDSSHQRIAVYTYDSQNSDSVVQELMNSDTLRSLDLIIGPTAAGQAKIVAAFCRKNRIINIQPFVASKAFSTENPYLVRFMPTIDAHLQKEYEMVMDSFSDANIIVYTTRRERDISAARQLDTLFKAYNDINTHKLRYSFVNSGDSLLPMAKRSLSAYLDPVRQNVLMMTCYDEPVVNAQLRTLKENTIVFGMPTWIDAEQIRVDYLNKAQAYFTDNYYVDTAQVRVRDFVAAYTAASNQPPSRMSYMGYDAMHYLSQIFRKYGKNLKLGFDNESYDGLGFAFHISPVIRMSKANGEPVINYYANTAMHLFQVSDYKVWMIR